MLTKSPTNPRGFSIFPGESLQVPGRGGEQSSLTHGSGALAQTLRDSLAPAFVHFRGRKRLITMFHWYAAPVFGVTSLHLSLTLGPARIRRFSENNKQEEVKNLPRVLVRCSHQCRLWQVVWLLTKDKTSSTLAGHHRKKITISIDCCDC